MPQSPRVRYALIAASVLSLLGTTSSANDLTGQHLATYFADTPADIDEFGSSVDLDDGIALIGAFISPRGVIDSSTTPQDPSDPSNRLPFGAAFAFDTETHQLQDTITAADFGRSRIFFGRTVALHNGIAVIGDGGFFNSPQGSTASVYDLNSQTPITVLEPPQEMGFSDRGGFGSAIALNDNTIFVGHQGSGTQTFMGSVHGFRTDDFSPAGVLSPEEPLGDTRFGAAVAANNDYAVVATADATLHVFDAATQLEIHEIDLSSCGCLQGFSSQLDRHIDVDIDGDLAIVSPVGDAGGGGANSNVLIVDLISGEVVRELIPSVPPDFDLFRFGFSVAIDNGLAVVGAPGSVANGVDDRGAVFVFNAATGEQLSHLSPTATPDFSHFLFGISVALDDDLLLVGSTRGGELQDGLLGGQGIGHGSAQLFRLVPEPSGAMLVATLIATLATRRRS